MKISDFMTSSEAAKFLGVSQNTLRNWEKEKKIKVYINPINNYRLYIKEDLEEVLRQITPQGKE